MHGHMQELLCGMGLGMKDLAGIGMALPGHIYFSRGVIITASNLPNWSNYPPRKNCTP